MIPLPGSQPPFIPLLLSAILFFAYRIVTNRDGIGLAILYPLLVSTGFFCLAALAGRAMIPWQQRVALGAFHQGLFLSYVGIERLLWTGSRRPIVRRKLFVAMTTLSIITLTSEIPPMPRALVTVGSAADLAALLHAGMQVGVLGLISWQYIHSLGRHPNTVYVVRRLLCLTGYLIALGCVVITLGHGVAGGGSGQHGWVLSDCPELLVSCAVLMVGFMLPHAQLRACIRPLEHGLACRRRRQQAARQELHRLMIQVVPSVQLGNPRLHHLRVVIEISDARQILWSHVDRRAPITPHDEARYLHRLLQSQTVFWTAGSCIPPPLAHTSVLAHNHATVIHLTRLRRRAGEQHRSAMSGMQEQSSAGPPK